MSVLYTSNEWCYIGYKKVWNALWHKSR